MKITKTYLRQIIKEETEKALFKKGKLNEWDMPFVGKAARLNRVVAKVEKDGGVHVEDALKAKGRFLDDDEWNSVYAAMKFFDEGDLNAWLEEREYEFTYDDLDLNIELQSDYDKGMGAYRAGDAADAAASKEEEESRRQASEKKANRSARLRKSGDAKIAANAAAKKKADTEAAQEKYQSSYAGQRAARADAGKTARSTDHSKGGYGEPDHRDRDRYQENRQRKKRVVKQLNA